MNFDGINKSNKIFTNEQKAKLASKSEAKSTCNQNLNEIPSNYSHASRAYQLSSINFTGKNLSHSQKKELSDFFTKCGININAFDENAFSDEMYDFYKHIEPDLDEIILEEKNVKNKNFDCMVNILFSTTTKNVESRKKMYDILKEDNEFSYQRKLFILKAVDDENFEAKKTNL